MITEPYDRFSRINDLMENFTKEKFLDDWKIKVNNNFTTIIAKQLYNCKVIDPKGNKRDWQEYEQKKFAHTQPV